MIKGQIDSKTNIYIYILMGSQSIAIDRKILRGIDIDFIDRCISKHVGELIDRQINGLMEVRWKDEWKDRQIDRYTICR